MIKKELSKMTKKEKKEYYNQFRNTWQINPVTRKPPNPKAYNRKKSRSWKNELHERDVFFYSATFIVISSILFTHNSRSALVSSPFS